MSTKQEAKHIHIPKMCSTITQKITQEKKQKQWMSMLYPSDSHLAKRKSACQKVIFAKEQGA